MKTTLTPSGAQHHLAGMSKSFMPIHANSCYYPSIPLILSIAVSALCENYISAYPLPRVKTLKSSIVLVPWYGTISAIYTMVHLEFFIASYTGQKSASKHENGVGQWSFITMECRKAPA